MSWSTNGGQVPHGRPITPSEIRSVVFTTTRMRLGYDVAEVDSFLDQIEWSMETMIAEINRLQRQISDIDRAHAASLDDARMAAEQLLMRLGGPSAAAGAAGFRSAGVMPAAAAQPRRAAATPPPGWSPAPTSPVGQQGGPAPMPRALPSPPPRGRPAANLPPPTGAMPHQAPPVHGFPPPRG